MKQQILIAIVFFVVGLIQLDFIVSVGILPPGDLWLALNNLLHGLAQFEHALRLLARNIAARFKYGEAGNQDQPKPDLPDTVFRSHQQNSPHRMVKVTVEVWYIDRTEN